MANELTLKGYIKFEKNSALVTMDTGTLSINVAGSQFIHNVQSVGTSEELIALGDIPLGGRFFAINRSTTNYVKIRQGTGTTDLIRIDPLGYASFRFDDSAGTPYWIADTAACEVEYLLVED